MTLPPDNFQWEAKRDPFGVADHMRHGDNCSACLIGPWFCRCGGLVHENTHGGDHETPGDAWECDCCGSEEAPRVPCTSPGCEGTSFLTEVSDHGGFRFVRWDCGACGTMQGTRFGAGEIVYTR